MPLRLGKLKVVLDSWICYDFDDMSECGYFCDGLRLEQISFRFVPPTDIASWGPWVVQVPDYKEKEANAILADIG